MGVDTVGAVDLSWATAAVCDRCGATMHPADAHWPHHGDCPQMRWGATYCGCDMVTCRRCCTGCPDDPAATTPPFRVMLLVTAMFVLMIAQLLGLAARVDGHRVLCPDRNGACIYVP